MKNSYYKTAFWLYNDNTIKYSFIKENVSLGGTLELMNLFLLVFRWRDWESKLFKITIGWWQSWPPYPDSQFKIISFAFIMFQFIFFLEMFWYIIIAKHLEIWDKKMLRRLMTMSSAVSYDCFKNIVLLW